MTEMLFNINRNAEYNRPPFSDIIIMIFHYSKPPIRFYNSKLKCKT